MSWDIVNTFWYQALLSTPDRIALKVLLPPVLYGLHGWFATKMAVWLLFHPYEPWYFPGTKFQVPLTPGIFPKRRGKLAQAVATTVTETLLTPADIKSKAETLLTENNIYLSIDLFVESVLLEFRDTTKLHRLASDIAELSPTLLHHFLRSTIDSVKSGKDKRIASITEKIFDGIILNVRISYEQGNELAARFMEAFVTPHKVRTALVALLSPQNISALDESIQAHAGGPYRILARIIGVKRVCYEWRNFLEKEPEESHKIIDDLIKRFGIRDQIALQIANFDMRALPLQTIGKLKENLVSFVESFLVTHSDDLLSAVSKIENEAMGTVRAAIIHFNPATIPSPWVERVKRDLSTFAYSYLKRELGVLLEKAIPALGMYALIAQKIDLFSAQQIEKLVYRICEHELVALENFGGYIGFFLGVIQIFVNAISP
jgi:uncharacterized membrane protein YheB (UPF0754 family)